MSFDGDGGALGFPCQPVDQLDGKGLGGDGPRAGNAPGVPPAPAGAVSSATRHNHLLEKILKKKTQI